jgi:hypothetical protein
MWRLAAGGVAIISFALVLVACLNYGLRPATVPAEPVDGPVDGLPVIYVNRSGENGAATTVDEALRRAKNKHPAGARILLQNDIAEVARIHNSNITIEPDGDRSIAWKPPPQLGATVKTLLLLFSAENVHLKGVSIDGDNRIDDLIKLVGNCASTSLRDLRLKGFNRSGVDICNCIGGPGEHRVALVNLSFRTTKADQRALFFDHNDNLAFPANLMVVVRNPWFEGPGMSLGAKNKRALVPGAVNLPPVLQPKQ